MTGWWKQCWARMEWPNETIQEIEQGGMWRGYVRKDASIEEKQCQIKGMHEKRKRQTFGYKALQVERRGNTERCIYTLSLKGLTMIRVLPGGGIILLRQKVGNLRVVDYLYFQHTLTAACCVIFLRHVASQPVCGVHSTMTQRRRNGANSGVRDLIPQHIHTTPPLHKDLPPPLNNFL